jgi:hypothetical protein
MAKPIFYKTPSRVNKVGRKVLLAVFGHKLALCAILVNAWTAATLQRFFVGPAADSEQRYRASADPPLRNCLRCSKIECCTS